MRNRNRGTTLRAFAKCDLADTARFPRICVVYCYKMAPEATASTPCPKADRKTAETAHPICRGRVVVRLPVLRRDAAVPDPGRPALTFFSLLLKICKVAQRSPSRPWFGRFGALAHRRHRGCGALRVAMQNAAVANFSRICYGVVSLPTCADQDLSRCADGAVRRC
jgi:hypothetical protein